MLQGSSQQPTVHELLLGQALLLLSIAPQHADWNPNECQDHECIDQQSHTVPSGSLRYPKSVVCLCRVTLR